MARNMKKLVCSILAVLMLSTLFLVSAGAASGSLRIDNIRVIDPQYTKSNPACFLPISIT